jgi:hypothetical protein
MKSADPAASSIPSRPESQGDLLSPPSPAKQSWRDLIKVHPAADRFPMMTDAELVELGKDIVKNGVKQWLVCWTPERVEQFVENEQCDWYLLDGRNRLEALERVITDPQERVEAVRRALQVGAGGFAGFPKKGGGGSKHLYGDIDPYEYVISANLHRRHLTRKQKRELTEKLLKLCPERSDREIARLAKVTDKTAATARQSLEATAEIPQLHERTGADGKVRPARRSTVNVAPEPGEPAAQTRAKAISNFSTVLHRKLADTLDDLTYLLRDEASRIAQIPHQKRVALARSYLQALGVSPDDLSADDARVQ